MTGEEVVQKCFLTLETRLARYAASAFKYSFLAASVLLLYTWNEQKRPSINVQIVYAQNNSQIYYKCISKNVSPILGIIPYFCLGDTHLNIQFNCNCICIALDHRYSLKGLNKPYIYEPPPTLAPKRPRKNFRWRPHLFLLLAETVPHGGHDLGHLAEGGVGVLALDGGLGVSEEQRVRRHRLLRLVGVLLLLLLWSLGLLGGIHGRGPLLPDDLSTEHDLI